VYVHRGELIQGVNGFLSQTGYAVQGHDGNKWIDILRGPVESTRGGKYKTYGGAKSTDENGNLAEKPWKKALQAAGLDDAKARKGSITRSNSVTDVEGAQVTAVELVVVKLKQQLHTEIKKKELTLSEAQALIEGATKIGTVDPNAFCPDVERKVHFHMRQIRITEVDTHSETFEASFRVVRCSFSGQAIALED
jgi:hypothetical protein